MTNLILRRNPNFNSFVNEFFGLNDMVDTIPFNKFNNVNFKELSDKYLLSFAVPGYKKDDIKINLEGDVISIESNVENTNSDGDVSSYYKKSFKYQYSIPDDIDVNMINAKQEDGILTLELKKKEVKNDKKLIEIK